MIRSAVCSLVCSLLPVVVRSRSRVGSVRTPTSLSWGLRPHSCLWARSPLKLSPTLCSLGCVWGVLVSCLVVDLADPDLQLWTLAGEVPAMLAQATPVAPSPRGATGPCCALTGRLDSKRNRPCISVLCQSLKSCSGTSFQVQKCMYEVALSLLYFTQDENCECSCGISGRTQKVSVRSLSRPVMSAV